MAWRQKKLDEFNRPIGKLGNYVYYVSGGVYRRRLYVKPVQPGTPLQKGRWKEFARYVKKYQQMLPAEKQIWIKKGEEARMTGMNYYISYRFSI